VTAPTGAPPAGGARAGGARAGGARAGGGPAESPSSAVPDYRPRFPDGPRPAIGILGCGRIAQTAHLPAYAAYGLDVAGVWSRTRATTAGVPERFGVVRRVYATAEDLRIAVNQNARWAPPWRLATLLVEDGAIGDVVGVTHLHDKPLLAARSSADADGAVVPTPGLRL
jgi:predicted dehydrogenase